MVNETSADVWERETLLSQQSVNDLEEDMTSLTPKMCWKNMR